MRAVLFEFYTIEIIINMVLMFFHIRGFLEHSLDFLPITVQISHHFYTMFFYVYTMVTMFASIGICLGRNISLCEEIIRSLVGFLVYTIISLMTLEDAEHDFHLMYVMGDNQLRVEKPLHPFFELMRTQAVCALVCAIAYLLHGIIMLDVLLSNDENFAVNSHEDEDGYEGVDFAPARLYVMGYMVHSYLERKNWFKSFTRNTMKRF